MSLVAKLSKKKLTGVSIKQKVEHNMMKGRVVNVNIKSVLSLTVTKLKTY